MPRLLKIEEAAEILGVPKGSLRIAAQTHGLTVKMGRTIRIDENCLSELIEKCRERPKVPDFTGEKILNSGSSVTPDAQIVQQAQAIAQTLKKRSRPT